MHISDSAKFQLCGERCNYSENFTSVRSGMDQRVKDVTFEKIFQVSDLGLGCDW